jgi:hypothetical protein
MPNLSSYNHDGIARGLLHAQGGWGGIVAGGTALSQPGGWALSSPFDDPFHHDWKFWPDITRAGDRP